MLGKLLYKLGVKYRNPSLHKYYEFLKESQYWDDDRLMNYQFLKCKDLLIFAYEHTKFYKNLFDENNFDPYIVTSVKDLKNIPSLNKDDLINCNNDIHSDYKFKKLFFSETSGTSGQVLKFKRNEEWDSHNRAAMFRGYDWYGVKPWDINGYFWGYNIDKKKRIATVLLDLLQNRFRLFSYSDKELLLFCKKLKKAKFISGYSSMIYETAKLVNEKGLSGIYKIKMIKGTSEKIYDSYQNEVKQAFGLNIISEYGASEAGLIAYECPSGNMHINVENVIVEEENGEILVTNLLSKSFPIIRYKLGDSIRLAEKNFRCPCGRKHQVIFDVIGRVGKNILGKKHKYPSLTLYYIFKNIALNHDLNLNYQAIQNVKGELSINIEQPDNGCSLFIKNEAKKYFGEDIEVFIEFAKKLHAMNGKLKDFITTLD